MTDGDGKFGGGEDFDRDEFARTLAETLLKMERDHIVRAISGELDGGHTWDMALVRGLLALAMMNGALCSSMDPGVVEVIQMSTLHAVMLGGGVDKHAEMVLSALRAHEAGLGVKAKGGRESEAAE
jgi:hypothetical protein